MSKNQITIPFFIPHRGCPNICSFCNQKIQTGSEPDPDDIIEIIRKYRLNAPVNIKKIELAFFGGTFTAINPDLMTKYLDKSKEAIKLGLIDSTRISTRPDAIDSEILSFISAYGVRTVEIGAQSFSDDVLEANGRGHTSRQTVDACNLIKKSGMNLVIQLLPGLPFDNSEKSVDSAIIAASLMPDAVRIYPAVVFKDTKLAEIYSRGDYNPMTLDEAVERCSQIYSVFTEKNIPVIRTGIHPLGTSSVNDILAGPYHPAFGFLVKSRVCRNKLDELISRNNKQNELKILLPMKNREEYIGMKKENIMFLENKYGKPIKYGYHSGEKALLI